MNYENSTFENPIHFSHFIILLEIWLEPWPYQLTLTSNHINNAIFEFSTPENL